MMSRSAGSRLFAFSIVAAGILGWVDAAEFKRLDGIYRIEKGDAAQVTARAVAPEELFWKRDGDLECNAGSKLCPESLDGGCCPTGYECARESCFATTRGPSTCLGQVGWYGCAAEFGGGCCPEGYICSTGDNCVPPRGVSYTYECSAGYYLCPESLNYGCCPNGLGCGMNQCYSTDVKTQTTRAVVTTTNDEGDERTVTVTVTTTITPRVPTGFPHPDDDDYNAEVVKFYPDEVPKVEPTNSPDNDDDGGGGLSTGALVGIIVGAVAFLVIVIVAAFIIIRHLNKVVEAVAGSKNGAGSAADSRPPVAMVGRRAGDDDDEDIHSRPRGYSKPTAESDVDTLGPPTETTNITATSFAGTYQPVTQSYFDGPLTGAVPTKQDERRTAMRASSSSSAMRRISDNSAEGVHLPQHMRNYSDVSDDSNRDNKPGITMVSAPGYQPQQRQQQQQQQSELHGRSMAQELDTEPQYNPTSPGWSEGFMSPLSPLDEARRRSSGIGFYGGPTSGSNVHQRSRHGNGSGGGGAGGRPEVSELGIVTEEWHGYYGPSDGPAIARGDESPADQQNGPSHR